MVGSPPALQVPSLLKAPGLLALIPSSLMVECSGPFQHYGVRSSPVSCSPPAFWALGPFQPYGSRHPRGILQLVVSGTLQPHGRLQPHGPCPIKSYSPLQLHGTRFPPASWSLVARCLQSHGPRLRAEAPSNLIAPSSLMVPSPL